MIKLMQFCKTFNLDFRIIPHTSLLDGVTMRIERKEDKKVYRQMLTHEELYGIRYNLWFDFESYIFVKLVEEFNLDIDAWRHLKQQWREGGLRK